MILLIKLAFSIAVFWQDLSKVYYRMAGKTGVKATAKGSREQRRWSGLEHLIRKLGNRGS